jgi:hypothetical protein
MQMNDAGFLRQSWKKKGDPPCDHPSTEREYHLGAHTGDTVCTVCGRIVDESHQPMLPRLLTNLLNKSMREDMMSPRIKDPALRQFIIDMLRQQEGLKRKLKELLDK